MGRPAVRASRRATAGVQRIEQVSPLFCAFSLCAFLSIVLYLHYHIIHRARISIEHASTQQSTPGSITAHMPTHPIDL